MKTDGSDFKEKHPEKSESEKLFDSLLFNRQLASLSVERLRITKELEQLLPENQTEFINCLSVNIGLYENELEDVLNVDEDDPVPEFLKNSYYDKNTTLAQYLYAKRIFILDYLKNLETLFNERQKEKIIENLRKTHSQDISTIFNVKKKIENDFPLLEKLTMVVIKESADSPKNEELKKALEGMKNDLISNGFGV